LQWTCNEEAESVRLAEYCSEARGAACVCVCVCACALRVRECVCARVWYVLAHVSKPVEPSQMLMLAAWCTVLQLVVLQRVRE
jgi:hypothetical protein